MCILPLLSVTGTLCTLCTPLSYLSVLKTFLPITLAITSLKPPASPVQLSIISYFQSLEFPYIVYILKSSPAKREASCPPAPALISSITDLSSSGSLNFLLISISIISFSISSTFVCEASTSFLAIEINA